MHFNTKNTLKSNYNHTTKHVVLRKTFILNLERVGWVCLGNKKPYLNHF